MNHEAPMILQGLNEIDWATLGHAYGSAEDVPGLLRELASPDAQRGEKALYAFYGTSGIRARCTKRRRMLCRFCCALFEMRPMACAAKR